MFDNFFTKQLEIKLTASMLGISKKRWEFVYDHLPNKEIVAKQKMSEKHFDVLPVIKKIGNEEIIESYYFTCKWNKFGKIQELKIRVEDLIDFQTNIRDIVKLFASNSKQFYFLKSKNEVVGLITLANLNAKEFRIFLYSLTCELEILMRDFISSQLSEKEILKIISDNENEQFKIVLDNYYSDQENGLEDYILEYLYLVQFIKIISTQQLYEQLGFKSKRSFIKEFSSLNEIRNQIAHPTRSLIKSLQDIEKLHERLENLEEAISKLKTFMENE
jgi:hypothetical protein